MLRGLREFLVRIAGTLRWRRSDADIEEELRSHLAFAEDEARRRDEPVRNARLRVGHIASARDGVRDQSHFAWLDSVRLDAVFACRQLIRYRAANPVAILSLGLAIGTTTAAVRLVDAMLLRPLPVADPSRLIAVTIAPGSGPTAEPWHDFDYPTYREYARAVGDRADVMVVGRAARQLVSVRPGDEPEPVFRQFISGNVFGVFGLQPAAGRLLTPGDDDAPGAHPVAVIGYDWWTRRLDTDPGVIGRTIRIGNAAFEIVGVAPRGFTGTEPGTITDVFVPATMNVAALDSPGWSWFLLWLRPRPAESAVTLQQLLQARFPKDNPRVESAEAGVSGAQETFRRPLLILTALAAIVLLVACANVANLLSARAIARGREMSLRISIGAGRGRLIQLVLIESFLLALIASGVGAWFASQASPIVIAMLSQPERPIRLVLDSGWRALGFGVVLTISVTLFFGLLPALRASAAKPVEALKATGSASGPGAGTLTLIGLQVALATFLLVAGALFAGTFGHLMTRELGFSFERVLLLVVEATGEQSAATWSGVARQVRQVAGVDSATVAGWAPLSGNRWHGEFRAPGVSDRVAEANVLDVAPSYFDALRIGLLYGRDFAAGERDVAIVNEAFARALFDGGNPIGRRVLRHVGNDSSPTPVTIVGLVRDAVYMSVRESPPATMYVPLEARGGGTVIVRTAGPPASMAPVIRRALEAAYPALRVRGAERFGALVEQQMVKERLLAALSTFFATVALIIAGLGLYGVLNGTVVRRRREIGIRIALGARTADVVRRVAAHALFPVLPGVAAGLAAGVLFGRAARSLLFEIVPGQPASLVLPLVFLTAGVLVATLPPAVRASRIDPAATLRSE